MNENGEAAVMSAEGAFDAQGSGAGSEINGIQSAGLTQQDADLASFTMEDVPVAPFVPTYLEQLQLGGERALTWKKLLVPGKEGFVEIPDVCDVEQIYANGQLVADNFYYGRPWRVPAKLLYGKECYLVMSEWKDDFYREW